MARPILPNSHYTVAWICALPVERTAGCSMLDVEHDGPSEVNPGDENSYQLGRIGKHNIVIASLPLGSYGTTSAAVVATQMKSTFRSIKAYLMVGIGGGIPKPSHDIRLGDIVISKPENNLGGVVQYDLGKTVKGGNFERCGSLNKPPQILLTAIAGLQASHELKGINKICNYLSETYKKHPSLAEAYTYQGQEHDVLYKADYEHGGDTTCVSCNIDEVVSRKVRKSIHPVIHYGTIASGNQVIKHGITRDRIGNDSGAICFEMEAAGLMDHCPCLVIRGICDYSDSHKNKRWQPYAALTAAAYTKELLSQIAPLAESGGPGKQDPPQIVKERIFDIPRILHPHFSGRQKHLQQLYDSLHRDSTSERGAIVSIFGIPGVGKSQLCLKYVTDNRNKYNFGFYSIAKTVDHWLSSCNNIALALNLPEAGSIDQVQITQALKRWFASNSDWVLIIDDVSSSVVELLRSSLPQDLNGHIIISTRDKHIAHEFCPSACCIQLQEMDSTEGKELVLKISGREGDTSEVAERISQELGGLPLALEQSVRCAVQRCWNLSTLYDSLQESKLQVVNNPIENPHHADVVTTLDIALKELEPAHIDILKLILWMHPQALPLALLTDGAPFLSYVRGVYHMRGGANNSSSEVNTTATQGSKTWKKRVQSRFKGFGLMKSKTKIESTELQHEDFEQQTKLQAFNHMKEVLQSKPELDKVILVLEKSSIVRRSGNGGIWVHDLFREILQSKIEESERKVFVQYAAQIVCRAFPIESFHATSAICSSYLPHALEVMMLLEKYNLHNEETISTMKSIGGHYHSSGRTSESLQWTQHLLKITNDTLGRGHRESFLIMNQIGIILGVRGSSGEALQMYTRALIGLAGVDFIQAAQDRFVNINNLATAAQNEGIGEVFQLCQCVLKAISYDQDHKACPDWETILTVIHNIANALSYQVSSGEGIELYREILTTEVKLIGDEDPTTICTAGGLIISLAENRRYEEALELCSHFIPRLISIYGENDWPTLNTLYYQAVALFGQGNYDEARRILEMVISRVKNTYGEDRPFVYQSIRLLGQVLEKQGHDDEAMAYFEQAYSGSERFFGNNHYEVRRTARCIRYLKEKFDRVPEV
ncbi:hypothetical protein TWF569_004664 [Orbilia oligospora]|uniref:Uncharacterized protein n=1 Tax=Orbilia oligospora TaxID=2813651 RepID=A0A7C8JHW9_ORBOL|nr:hypothetical protein TWF103_008734 [Orbilia oligospora]KAF3105363.1 hypothetical protein TWF102_002288 [Orbilia oligospora]KAF3115079.1 hypothetical protein TWF706_007201 [Orbilia oligospora]KAF3150203.1 hypothetical protein TWF594_010083 [Orbilia oligospora]KAF3150269.1 hypothetical protein TWF569_004664 [Orbilia oligospora]